MRKILIFYGSYGHGHFSAANSVKEYIDNNYNDTETRLIDCIEYVNKLFNKITTKGYSYMAKNAHWAWKHLYFGSEKGFLKLINNNTQKLMAIKLNKLIQDYNPDLIISTHPFSSYMCAFLKKKNEISIPIATVLTDYVPHDQWLNYPVYIDYFFVAHEGMKKDLLQKNIRDSQIKATGIPFSDRFLTDYDKEKTVSEFNLSLNKHTILFFANTVPNNIRNKVLNILAYIMNNVQNVQTVIISGKSKKSKKYIDNFVIKNNLNDNIKVLNYTNKIPELMSISDLTISKPGGLTVTESLISGVPIIMINPLPGQEEENAKFFQEKKAGVWIKNIDEMKDTLFEIISSNDKLNYMKENTRSLAKKHSTKDICETLMKKL